MIRFRRSIIMKNVLRQIVAEQKQKTVLLSKLEKNLKHQLGDNIGPFLYRELADEILRMEEEGLIEPIKSAKIYPRDIRVKDRYKKMTKSYLDEEALRNDLLTNYHTKISGLYYLKNLREFQREKSKIEKISQFLESVTCDEPYLSANERSFELFHDEKYLNEQSGKNLLSNLCLTLDDLYCFETFEPFIHIGQATKENENILIVENLDTFYSLMKLYLEGMRSWNGIEFSMIIYGEGNKITKSFAHLDELGVPEATKIYYFGDFDREGINIYYRIANRSNRPVKAMNMFYKKMYKRRSNKKSVKKQYLNERALVHFFEENAFEEENEMKDYLIQGQYIPQEAVNIEVLRRMADGAEESIQRN